MGDLRACLQPAKPAADSAHTLTAQRGRSQHKGQLVGWEGEASVDVQLLAARHRPARPQDCLSVTVCRSFGVWYDRMRSGLRHRRPSWAI